MCGVNSNNSNCMLSVQGRRQRPSPASLVAYARRRRFTSGVSREGVDVAASPMDKRATWEQ